QSHHRFCLRCSLCVLSPFIHSLVVIPVSCVSCRHCVWPSSTRKAKYSKLLPIEVADSKQPLQKAIVNLDDVTIIISKDGYEDIIILADNFAAFNQRSLVPVKVASGSWWKYANRAVSNQIKSCILETC
ncbi:hypothetical protein D0Y65_048176, partial [Glycine soja]